jgi:2-methylcitrate dehydratase PrpD
VFGAAAATSKFLQLTAEQTAHALGIAASQSAGLVENRSLSVKNVGVGNAPRNGICAALFAREGYVAAPLPIEGAFGWARASGDMVYMNILLGGLGDRWEFAKNTCKPNPMDFVMHSIVDGCLQLKREHALCPADIGSISVFGDA